jgi:hypothetical protein
MFNGVRFGAVVTYQSFSKDQATLKAIEINNDNHFALVTIVDDDPQLSEGKSKPGFTALALTGLEAQEVMGQLGFKVDKGDSKQDLDQKLYRHPLPRSGSVHEVVYDKVARLFRPTSTGTRVLASRSRT